LAVTFYRIYSLLAKPRCNYSEFNFPCFPMEIVLSFFNPTIMKMLSSPRKMKDTVREAAGRGRSNF
jgi:hypothetical protein